MESLDSCQAIQVSANRRSFLDLASHDFANGTSNLRPFGLCHFNVCLYRCEKALGQTLWVRAIAGQELKRFDNCIRDGFTHAQLYRMLDLRFTAIPLPRPMFLALNTLFRQSRSEGLPTIMLRVETAY